MATGRLKPVSIQTEVLAADHRLATTSDDEPHGEGDAHERPGEAESGRRGGTVTQIHVAAAVGGHDTSRIGWCAGHVHAVLRRDADNTERARYGFL